MHGIGTGLGAFARQSVGFVVRIKLPRQLLIGRSNPSTVKRGRCRLAGSGMGASGPGIAGARPGGDRKTQR